MKLLLVGHGARRFAALGAALILGVGSLATTACSEDAPADDVGGGGSVATGGSTGHTGGSASGGDGGGGGGGGQGGEPGTGGGPVAFIEKDIEDLAVTSAASYADNAYGVISGSTLAAYQADWAANKPAGVEGRLVILQVTPAGVNSSVLAARDNEHGVYSYLLPAARVAQARSNGLSAFETDIPDGPTADGVLKSFDIDPTKDFLVLTFEHQAATTNAVVQSVGRAWVFFNYWGWPKERLAILNGSVNWNASAGLQTTLVAEEDFNLPTNTGTKSFRDLHVDQTVASISLEELLAILKEDEGAPDKDKIRIVDARGGAEAYGLKKATSTGRTKCSSYDATTPGNPNNKKCSTPFEGRIKGASSVPWTQFVQGKDKGFSFLDPAAAKAIFDTQSGWEDGVHEQTIQYCRTNQRSTVTGIVANLILGYPTRLYETSFIEWGHLAARPAEGETTFPNANTLASDSPYRTDVETFTEHAVLDAADAAAYTPGGTLGALTQPVTWVAGPNYNDEADINPASVVVGDEWPKLNAAATTTRQSIEADRSYLRGE